MTTRMSTLFCGRYLNGAAAVSITPPQHNPKWNAMCPQRNAYRFPQALRVSMLLWRDTSYSLKVELPDIASLVRKPLRRLWLPKMAGSARRQRRLRITPTQWPLLGTAKGQREWRWFRSLV